MELPIQWLLDDAPHFWFDGAELDPPHLDDRGGAGDLAGGVRRHPRARRRCILTMHPQIIGRPRRLAMLDAFIGWVNGRDDVWIATCAEIAARA